ncbi:MAG: GHMP kinase [Cyclobacteriaceae bacterium]|nr:GHMP kinase [Cyclobacteriaceae bacterium]
MIFESRAYARAGLLGNPSDGYFGKTISIVVRNFGAHVSLYESPELNIEQQTEDRNIFRNIYQLVESVDLTGYYGGDRLVKAAIKKFCEYCEKQSIKLNGKNFTIRYRSSIPRQVGLAGSSAIITATIKALKAFYEVEISKEILPNLVLSVETEELGIKAGLQDRVIQTYEGCVYMDFDKQIMDAQGHGNYKRIDATLLPSLYIAYKTNLGKVSGAVFNDVHARYMEGEPLVVDTLDEIGQVAADGEKAILKGDHERLAKLINKNFDLRAKIFNISDSNYELVKSARKCGASAKFTGSGGSIIGTYNNDETLRSLIINMHKLNARVIKPFIV